MKNVRYFVVVATLSSTTILAQYPPPVAKRMNSYHDFNYGQIQDQVEQWVQAIRVSEPELRSEIRGDVTVRFQAAGMTEARATPAVMAGRRDR